MPQTSIEEHQGIPDPTVRDWDFPRSAVSALLLTRFAAEHGMDPETALRGTGLTLQGLEAPDASVKGPQELAIVRNMIAGIPDTDLGYRAGRQYHLTAYGILGFAFTSSPTVREGMRMALRYLELSFAFCIPRVRQGSDSVLLQLDDESIPADVRGFLVERDLAAIRTIMLDLLPSRVPIRSISLKIPKPAHAGEYEREWGVMPSFGQAANLVAFDPGYLDHQLPQANSHTAAMCEFECRELLARRRARQGMARQVRDELLSGVGLSMDDVAKRLHTTSRTLHRRLSAEGTSFQALRDEVRSTRAEEMLTSGVLSVDDVAIRLGYAEAASFIHAFKRWTGTTPAAFARRHSPR